MTRQAKVIKIEKQTRRALSAIVMLNFGGPWIIVILAYILSAEAMKIIHGFAPLFAWVATIMIAWGSLDMIGEILKKK